MVDSSPAAKWCWGVAVLAVLSGWVAAGVAPWAVAQEAGPATQTEAVYAFDVPRGDLASVVIQLARITATPVAFPADAAAGHVAGPVQGRHTVVAAFSQALAGTGLECVPGPGFSFTIRLAADPAARRPAARPEARADAF